MMLRLPIQIWRLLLLYATVIYEIQGESINVTFDPVELVVKVRETLPVYFNVAIPLIEVNPLNSGEKSFGNIEILSADPSIAEVINGSSIDQSVFQDLSYQFFVNGRFIGRTKLQVRLCQSPTECKSLAEYPVSVLRGNTMTTLTSVFTITMAVLIVITTYIMGLQLEWKVILNVLKKPIAPAIGFGCQYVVMPLIAAGWALLLLRDAPYLQFGYFAVGCAPGGGASNFWTLLLDGNLNLSVTMTFFSNVAALAMMPFWLYTLGQIFFARADGKKISIPFTNVILSLVFLLGPVFAGIIVGHFKPHLVHKSKTYVKICTIAIILVAVVFGSICNAYVFYLITWKTLLCGLLLPWAGFGLSYFISFMIRQDHRNCRTIAIETGIQNAGVAIVLLQTSLKHPDGDLAMVMPVCVLIFTPIPLAVALAAKIVGDCIRKRKLKDAPADDIVYVKSQSVEKSHPHNGDHELMDVRKKTRDEVGYSSDGENVEIKRAEVSGT